MDFNLNEYHRNISDELLLEDVKDISKKPANKKSRLN